MVQIGPIFLAGNRPDSMSASMRRWVTFNRFAASEVVSMRRNYTTSGTRWNAQRT